MDTTFVNFFTTVVDLGFVEAGETVLNKLGGGGSLASNFSSPKWLNI